MTALKHCGAKTRNGGQCTQAAGWGTDHVGYGKCKLHGGSHRNGRKAAAREEATEQMNEALQAARDHGIVVMGKAQSVDPHEALLECIAIAAGEVRYATGMIAGLDPSEAVGAVVTTRPLKEEKGAESQSIRIEEHGPPALHIWIQVRHQAMDRLANYSRIAITVGIAERQVRIAEQQGQLLAQVIRGVLADLGVADHPEAPAVVRRHLTLVAGAQAS